MSYLPAAHSFEQCLLAYSFMYGLKIGFFGGNPLKLLDDLMILKPTFFPVVPRVLNKIFGKINEKVGGLTGIQSWLVNKAINAKMHYIEQGQGFNHKLYDSLVFSKMKALLGGNVRIMVTGSAPVERKVLDMIKICFCATIIEGYGQTEVHGAATFSLASNPESGNVGSVHAFAKARLRDLPEMDYLSTNDPPRGEICFAGQFIMPGYFMNPEKT